MPHHKSPPHETKNNQPRALPILFWRICATVTVTIALFYHVFNRYQLPGDSD